MPSIETTPPDYETIRDYVGERMALTIGAILPHLEREHEVVLVLKEGKFGFRSPDLVDQWRNTFDPILQGHDAYIVEPVKNSPSKTKFRRSTRHLPDELQPAGHRAEWHKLGKPIMLDLNGEDYVAFKPPEPDEDIEPHHLRDDDQPPLVFDDRQMTFDDFDEVTFKGGFMRKAKLPV